MAVSNHQLFKHLTMTPAQEERALRYLHTGDEGVLSELEPAAIKDQQRRQFAWQFEEEFRKTYRWDPVFFRLFYRLLGRELLSVTLARVANISFLSMMRYFEVSNVPLNELIAFACQQAAKLAGDLNEADNFLRKLVAERPEYIEEQLQLLTGPSKLMLLLFMLDTQFNRFRSYAPILESELQEQPLFLLRMRGDETEQTEQVRKALRGEEHDEIHVSSSLPDVVWSLLFRVYTYSETAKRYIDILAQYSIKAFLAYAERAATGTQTRYGGSGLNEESYNKMKELGERFNIPGEHVLAYRLTGYNIEAEDLNDLYEYRLLLQIVEEEPERAEVVLSYTGREYYIFISALLAKKGREVNRTRLREEFLALALRSKPSDVRGSYRQYLTGELSFEDMWEILQSPRYRLKSWRMLSFEIALLWHIDDAVKREAAMSQRIDESHYYYGLYELLEHYSRMYGSPGQVIDDLLDYCLRAEEIASYAVSRLTVANVHENQEVSKVLMTFLIDNREYITGQFAHYNADERAFVLEVLAQDSPERTRGLLIESFGDSSKKVRAIAVEFLAGDEEAAQDVIEQLGSKKKTVREQAMRVLLYYKCDEYTKVVQEALEEKRNAALMEQFVPLLGSAQASGETGSVEALSARIMTPQKKKALLQWLGFEPHIRLQGSGKLADGIIPLAYFQQYISEAAIEKKEAAEAIRAVLHERDLQENVQAIYQLWISQGAETKRRGVLTLYGIHSDDAMALLLKKQIDEWALGTRGAIAAMAVQALALSESRLALMIINSMAFKYKHKQVRSAAKEALALAAKTRGITEEELEDQLIPDLGFNTRGEKTVDYGSRTFTAYLTPDLKVELKTQDGKPIKSLPKPNAKDDMAKAEEAKAELSAVKKQLRSIISMQTDRLETALSIHRYWPQRTWQTIFVDNPIMQQFAVSLIWGEYNGGSRFATFRYMEDGTFNNIEEDEHELTEGSAIGLVHPLELTEEEIAAWKQQLEDYEIVQPFLQIDRTVYRAQVQDETAVERFAGIQLNGRSLFGKLTKRGWSRGSVQDAGMYYSFYKEDARTGFGAELAFEGAPVGYEEDDVCIFEIQFYKAGTVKRGSYEYDEIDDARRIAPEDVSERFFSEVLYDVSRATAQHAGFEENWRNKR